MKYFIFCLLGFSALSCLPFIVDAGSSSSVDETNINWVGRLLTPEQAEAMVESGRLAVEAQEYLRREAALSIPALEQRVADIGDQQVVFRRVAELEKPELAQVEASSVKTALSPALLAAWKERQEQIHERISMAVNVYGGEYSEITWRDTETRKEYTVWTNVNLYYLRPINAFVSDGYRYDYFGFIYTFDRESERQRIEMAAKFGYHAESRWKIPPFVFSGEHYEYFVDAAPDAQVPEKLYQQLDALFAYYAEHREEFEVRRKNTDMLQAARKQSLEARPAGKPKQIIMNYTPLRGEAAQ
ncbi:MAG: hypothetical protein EA353_00995 [Puniceicoccaceae bacterium]|nr:MAG: hypothetical protein EA353_00995 [Puniceicoccaceae bacterium]